jgi:hypothetical protein
MSRDTIVQHIKARDQVIVWTASDSNYCWVFWPGKDGVDYVQTRDLVQNAGIRVRNLTGMGVLFAVFGETPEYYCKDCNQFHDSDDTAEWMLLAQIDRGVSQARFDQLSLRLIHPKTRVLRTPYVPLAHRMTEADRLGDCSTAWNDWRAKHPSF